MSVSLAILILYIAALFAISWYAKNAAKAKPKTMLLPGVSLIRR